MSPFLLSTSKKVPKSIKKSPTNVKNQFLIFKILKIKKNPLIFLKDKFLVYLFPRNLSFKKIKKKLKKNFY